MLHEQHQRTATWNESVIFFIDIYGALVFVGKLGVENYFFVVEVTQKQLNIFKTSKKNIDERRENTYSGVFLLP